MSSSKAVGCVHSIARNGGAAAADPSHIGQRWKKKMEAANLRAARECFRERNPLITVGHTIDEVSVLKVIFNVADWTNM